MKIAPVDLGLQQIAVLYPGTRRYDIGEAISAVPVAALEGSASIFE